MKLIGRDFVNRSLKRTFIHFQIIRFLSSFSKKISFGQRIDGNGSTSASECYVGSSTRLYLRSAGEAHATRSEMPIIKRSVIGEKCVIGPKSKIINSLLMEGCQIGGGYEITCWEKKILLNSKKLLFEEIIV